MAKKLILNEGLASGPETKQEIRQKINQLLGSFSAEDYQRFNVIVEEKFFQLEVVQQAKSVMIYYSIAKEVATVNIIERLLAMGKQVSLPVCRTDFSLDARRIQSLDQVICREFAKFTLMEPSLEATLIPLSQLELVVIPGVAFDEKGNRLGHGGGYYDRFLKELSETSFKLGLAYDFQIIDHIPKEAHDLSVDGLLTPSVYRSF